MAISETETYCSFCLTDSKALQKAQTLHAGLEAFICDDCVDTINYVKSKDYIKADEIRSQLDQNNVILEDIDGKTIWRVKK